MEEDTVTFELQNFMIHQCLNGVAMEGERKGNSRHGIGRLFSNMCLLHIYPNGNKPENENYVSIVYYFGGNEERLRQLEKYGKKGMSFFCVMSIVDANGNLRFPQSFGMNFEEEPFTSLLQSGYRGPVKRCVPLEVGRFVSRRVLLDASEGLLPGDTLILRCNISFFYSHNESKSRIEPVRNLRAVALKDSWFIKFEDGSSALDLRNVNSPLCTRLRKQSDFFRGLFRSSACKEMEDGYMAIEKFEFPYFRDMLFYVRFGITQHIRTYFDFLGVYKLACFYGVRHLEEICIEHFKQNLDNYNVIQILRIADSRGDADLRTLAFDKALANWYYLQSLQDWRDLGMECPQLANELSCAARILNLEKGLALCNIAAGKVILNRNKVQHTLTWSIFAKKLPDLAKVMLQFGSIKFNQAEDYNTASDYDFYR